MEGSLSDHPKPNADSEAPPWSDDLQGAAEAAVARIWREIFPRHRIGPDDNFFALGGDSLVAMRLADLFARELGVELPVVVLFRNPTVRELAGLLTPVTD